MIYPQDLPAAQIVLKFRTCKSEIVFTKMASSMEGQEPVKLYKFTKILALKVAQVVVQSRQGKKITQECNDIKQIDNGLSSSPTNLQWVGCITFPKSKIYFMLHLSLS